MSVRVGVRVYARMRVIDGPVVSRMCRRGFRGFDLRNAVAFGDNPQG